MMNINDLHNNAIIITSSLNEDSEYRSPIRFKSISRINNNHGMNMNINITD